ncbi:MAG: DUF2059 domain-containing protein [Planctomycetaceae bacterium]
MSTRISELTLSSCFLVGLLFAGNGIAQDAGDHPSIKLARILISDTAFNEFLDQVITVAPDVQIPFQGEINSRKKLIRQLQAVRPDLTSRIRWEKLQDKLARDLASRFSEDELQALLTFHRSEIGQKWLGQQAALSTEVFKNITQEIVHSYLKEIAQSQVSRIEAAMEGVGRKAIENARNGTPLPMEQLCRSWYEIIEETPGLTDYNLVERKTDGSFKFTGVTIDANEKTYTRITSRSHWFLEGRLLIETNEADPEIVTIYIIEQISATELQSRLVEEGSPVEDWIEIKETTTPFRIPSIPDGYELIEE